MLNRLIANLLLLALLSFHLLIDLIHSLEKFFLRYFLLSLFFEVLDLLVELVLRIDVLGCNVDEAEGGLCLGGGVLGGWVHDDRDVEVSLLILGEGLVALHSIHDLLNLRFRLGADRDVANSHGRIGTNEVLASKSDVVTTQFWLLWSSNQRWKWWKFLLLWLGRRC